MTKPSPAYIQKPFLRLMQSYGPLLSSLALSLSFSPLSSPLLSSLSPQFPVSNSTLELVSPVLTRHPTSPRSFQNQFVRPPLHENGSLFLFPYMEVGGLGSCLLLLRNPPFWPGFHRNTDGTLSSVRSTVSLRYRSIVAPSPLGSTHTLSFLVRPSLCFHHHLSWIVCYDFDMIRKYKYFFFLVHPCVR
ncbi:hypothetical protein FRC18_007108 [Serendipita sp. 400]|nr:hypothetical protein FRC18_007108 [Serendipita sp. 400]